LFKKFSPYFIRFLSGWLFTSQLISCNEKNLNNHEISFYYWKTNYSLTSYEKDFLKAHNVYKIYLRCFDVVLEDNKPVPQGVLLWKEAPEDKIDYIPTVFIQNNIFSGADTNSIKELAEKVLILSTQILSSQHLSLKEIQVDCDWTQRTRDSYFYFLTLLKKKKIIVSNTLRVYQYKYRKESGITPTDYATLMCYNMGNMKNEKAGNSILNSKDIRLYIATQQSYSQPLQIALPIFHWTLLYHDHVFKGILREAPKVQNTSWQKMSAITYVCTQDYYDVFCTQQFYKDDIIRIEEISKQELDESLDIIQKNVKNLKQEVIYFDLDSLQIRNCLD